MSQSLLSSARFNRARFADYWALTKPGITSMVVLSSLAGYLVASAGAVQMGHLVSFIVGTALVVGGAGVLNMFLERESDSLMSRTQERPLTAGRLRPQEVFIWGAGLSAAGLVYLAHKINIPTAFLAEISFFIYLFAYTPLKKVSPFCTEIGAVTGAIPPVMGWTAAQGRLSGEASLLFLILFFWQLPHFLAIGWMYRDEYAKAGFQILPVVDEEGGKTTGRRMVIYAAALLLVSLLPPLFGLGGPVYIMGSSLLGLGFLGFSMNFLREPSRPSAKKLFFSSLLYIPAILGLLVLG